MATKVPQEEGPNLTELADDLYQRVGNYFLENTELPTSEIQKQASSVANAAARGILQENQSSRR